MIPYPDGRDWTHQIPHHPVGYGALTQPHPRHSPTAYTRFLTRDPHALGPHTRTLRPHSRTSLTYIYAISLTLSFSHSSLSLSRALTLISRTHPTYPWAGSLHSPPRAVSCAKSILRARTGFVALTPPNGVVSRAIGRSYRCNLPPNTLRHIERPQFRTMRVAQQNTLSTNFLPRRGICAIVCNPEQSQTIPDPIPKQPRCKSKAIPIQSNPSPNQTQCDAKPNRVGTQN